MTAHDLVRNPRFVTWGLRVDRAPAWVWLALQFAALAPTWIWMARRMADGLDDPLGLLAVLAWHARASLRASPDPAWLTTALTGTVLATAARHGIGGVAAMPPLFAALLAVLSFAAALRAFLPQHRAAAPVLGLAVLALPLLSSLQFYAGYPLRLVTAEASRWLLAPAFTVLREGSTLLVDGRLVIVDAPCSGVQMVWLGYFTACVVALWARRTNHAVLARLPWVGGLVLAGNIVRNSLLVALEGAGHPPAEWVHQMLGLVVLALVCAAIAAVMARAKRRASFPHFASSGVRHAQPA